MFNKSVERAPEDAQDALESRKFLEQCFFLVSTDLHSIALPNHGGLLRFVREVRALSYLYIIVFT